MFTLESSFLNIHQHFLLFPSLVVGNLEHYKELQTTTDGLPTHSRLQSPDIEVEQRSLQIYEQLEGGDQS